ncbi:MAG: MBL fold metallo-hydrolase [Acidobacteriota bacterium]
MSEPSGFYEQLLREQTAGDRVRASASVVPWRERNGRLEVYWARRAATMPFMGGWHAFPGGGLSRRDTEGERAVYGKAQGLTADGQTAASPGLDERALERLGPDAADGIVTCALRELFEETGLWPLEKSKKSEAPALERLGPARRRLLEKEVTFPELFEELGLQVDASRLVFAGRWLTPAFVPTRFDNRFFLLHWPTDEVCQPTLEGGEHDLAEWIEPRRALEAWRTGRVMASPPILHILRVLAEEGPEKGLGRLRDTREADWGPMRRVEFQPGLVLLPLRTPTLPPATHTNCFVLGREQAVVIDPATTFRDETERLLGALDAARAGGYRFEAIWLSHHHPDHVGAVERTREHLGVPVLAHRDAAPRLEKLGIAVDGFLEGNQTVQLEGDPPLPVRVLHTPGHTRGHLSFFLESLGTLLASDLVSTLSTIIIDPPEGDMDAYLRSLERVAKLGPRVLFPSHGAATLEPVALLENTRRHRLEREAKVLEAYRRGLTSAEAMVREVYHEVPSLLHPVARRQIRAHLERLRRLGEI